MPQIFKIGGYVIYFWLGEGDPLEPVHVHVAEGVPTANATKFWITKTGNCILSNNNSNIPPRKLRYIAEVIEARHDEIEKKWFSYFGTIQHYC